MGAPNFAEDKFRNVINLIKHDDNALWIGGGDMIDAIIFQDEKRFDPSLFPEWMFEGSHSVVRKNLVDVVAAQRDRLLAMLDPIKDKCIGLIEGNHEYTIAKRHNRDLMNEMCTYLNVPDLTDCAFINLVFKHGKKQALVRGFVCHGRGGGRTPGAAVNILAKLAEDKDVDFLMAGHNHSYCITHTPRMSAGDLSTLYSPDWRPEVREVQCGNWGCYVYTYDEGPSTYASRANYPLRAMRALRCRIEPFYKGKHGYESRVEMEGIRL